jgi:hypothetical protein
MKKQQSSYVAHRRDRNGECLPTARPVPCRATTQLCGFWLGQNAPFQNHNSQAVSEINNILLEDTMPARSSDCRPIAVHLAVWPWTACAFERSARCPNRLFDLRNCLYDNSERGPKTTLFSPVSDVGLGYTHSDINPQLPLRSMDHFPMNHFTLPTIHSERAPFRQSDFPTLIGLR